MRKKTQAKQPVDDFVKPSQITPPTVDLIEDSCQAVQPADDYPFELQDKADFSVDSEDYTPPSVFGMDTGTLQNYPAGKKIRHKDNYGK